MRKKERLKRDIQSRLSSENHGWPWGVIWCRMRGFFFCLCLSQGAKLKEICGKYPSRTPVSLTPKSLLIHSSKPKTHTHRTWIVQPTTVLWNVFSPSISPSSYSFGLSMSAVFARQLRHICIVQCIFGDWRPDSPLKSQRWKMFHLLKKTESCLLYVDDWFRSVIPLRFLCCGGQKVFDVLWKWVHLFLKKSHDILQAAGVGGWRVHETGYICACAVTPSPLLINRLLVASSVNWLDQLRSLE